MTHLPDEAKMRRHRISSCRRGMHLFGPAKHIGAGINRQVCQVCSVVSIDLTGAEATVSSAVVRRPPRVRALAGTRR